MNDNTSGLPQTDMDGKPFPGHDVQGNPLEKNPPPEKHIHDPDAKDDIQNKLTFECERHDVFVDSYYRHYKGGYYQVINISVLEEPLKILVTYRSLKKDSEWTRTLDNFCSLVTDEKGIPVPRFVLIENLGQMLEEWESRIDNLEKVVMESINEERAS